MSDPPQILSVHSGGVRLGNDGLILYPATLSPGRLRIGLLLPRSVTGVTASQVSAWIETRDGQIRSPTDSTISTDANSTEIELRFEVDDASPALSLHLSGPLVGGDWSVGLRPG